MNNQSADAFGRPAFNFYATIKGFFKKAENLEALAREIGCPVDQLQKTIYDYNGFADERAKDEDFRDPFGKSRFLLSKLFKLLFLEIFPVKFDPNEPFFYAQITP